VAEVVETCGGDVNSRWFADLGDRAGADKINALATYNILAGDGSGAFRRLRIKFPASAQNGEAAIAATSSGRRLVL